MTIDGDLQDDPAEIPRLLAKLDEGYDLVSGWKTKRRDPLTRRIPSKIFNAVAGKVSGVRLHDMNCGLKAYRAEVVDGMQLYGELHRYIPVLAHYRGYRVTELPVNHRPREHGRSNYGVERYVRGFLDLLTVTFMGRYRHRPLHLFGGLGLLFSLLGSVDPRLPDDRQDPRARDRPAAAAAARRPARRRRDPAALARAHLRADHEPPRGAHRRRATGRPGSWTKCCGSRRASMRVLYFGTYDRAYPRNAQVISALRGAGVEVREQHRAGLGASAQLVGRAPPDAAGRRGRAQPAHAPATTSGTPTRSSSATPATSTCPRRSGSRGGGRWSSTRSSRSTTRSSTTGSASAAARRGAGVVHIVDRRAFRRADRVVADTEAHAEFFRDEFGLRPDRVEVCFVGAEDRLFRPGWQPDAPFHALFVGKLIPLHGLETILAAAALAPEIPFRIVGSGQLEHLLADRPAERRLGAVGRLRRACRTSSRRAGCALGIFGTTAKAARVIPNKAFQALACATPLITADTPAARELLTDGHDALLVPPGDPVALAAAVRRLAGDRVLADAIGAAGRATYEARASEAVLGARWRALLERAIAGA